MKPVERTRMQDFPGGLPIVNNPSPPERIAPARWLVRRADGQAARAYDALLARRDPRGIAQRFLLGPVGTSLVNTPVHKLPGELNLQPKHRVLDLQAGRAAILRALAARVPFRERPVALDSSRVALRLARRDLGDDPLIDVVAGLLVDLPFAAGSFDLVIAAHVFRRLDDRGLVDCLREAHRVLRPGGVVAGWEYAPRSSRALNRLHLRLLAAGPYEPYLRGFGPLVAAATEAGFHAIQRPLLPPFLFPPIPHTALLAQKEGRRED